MTDPPGGRPRTSPGSTGRPPLRIVLGVPVAFAGLVAVVVAAYFLVGDRPSADPQPRSTSATGSTLSPSDLAGEWSGKGSLTHCAGFEDNGCPGALPVSLTIDCSKKRCAVTPFDRSYGSPPLGFEDGTYRAAGPVPAKLAPTCGGVPTRSALWRLELTVQDGRLGGSYAESTVQGFNCGATGVAWQVTLDRT